MMTGSANFVGMYNVLWEFPVYEKYFRGKLANCWGEGRGEL